MTFRVLRVALAALFLSLTVRAEFTRPQAGAVSHLVGKVLEELHYRRSPLNDQTSEIFLKNYLNSLDYNHLVFLQADVDDFKSRYAASLDDLTLRGDAGPAFQIYDTYMRRLDERMKEVAVLLKEKYDFSADDSLVLNRNKEPWPSTTQEADKLWRARIKYELLSARLNKEKEEETAAKISRRYQRMEKSMKELDSEDVLQMYLTSLSHAYDPHSDYFAPQEAKNFEIQNISLSLSGIGAVLEWDDGYTKIRELIPGGPAELSKLLKPGDKVIAVAQGDAEAVDVVEMRLNKVVQLIRGKRGTTVKLTILHGADSTTKKVITLVRDEIKLKEKFAKASIIEVPDSSGKLHRQGVINLPQFYKDCSEHIETLLVKLKKEKVEGVILDLRHNGGGILEEAINLTGLFIKKGPVVQVKDSRRITNVLEDNDSKLVYDGPLVVMVSKLSASASEIVAAALQDYGRALIVGDLTTHGKGTVQQVLPLDRYMRPDVLAEPGELKITVSKFYRVAGGTTQKQGVTPDIVFPSIWDYMDIGEASLENCLPADKIPAADYKPLSRVKPYVAALAKQSKERLDTDKDFAYLREDIADAKRRQDEKSVSLNESKRVKERDDRKASVEARKKERHGRKHSDMKRYDIDLESAQKDKPLVLFVPKKEPAKNADAEAKKSEPKDDDMDDAPEPEVETEPLSDPHLREALQILGEYARALLKNPPPDLDNSVAIRQ